MNVTCAGLKGDVAKHPEVNAVVSSLDCSLTDTA